MYGPSLVDRKRFAVSAHSHELLGRKLEAKRSVCVKMTLQIATYYMYIHVSAYYMYVHISKVQRETLWRLYNDSMAK